jgi:outer membrane immunogenic protein
MRNVAPASRMLVFSPFRGILMKKLATAIAVITLIGTPALAADLNKPVHKAPPPAPAPVYNWTGWYVGLNAGWVDLNADANTNAVITSTSTAPINATNIAATATNQLNNRADGFIGGGQVGYNYQFSPAFVAGFEADIQGTTPHSNASVSSAVVGNALVTPPANWMAATTVSSRLDYLGTVRGRLGWLATPAFLLYGTGGLAYGGVKSSTSIDFTNTGGALPGFTSGSFSDTRTGWTAGAGFEWMFFPSWSAKLEYLHYDLGSTTYGTGGYSAGNVGLTIFPGTGIPAISTSTTVDFKGDIVRAGLNYQFH